jgi:hypothetical protein
LIRPASLAVLLSPVLLFCKSSPAASSGVTCFAFFLFHGFERVLFIRFQARPMRGAFVSTL